MDWQSSDLAIVGLSGQTFPGIDAVAQGPLGMARITVVGANANGDPVTGEIDINVIPGPAASILIEAAPAETI